MMQDAVKKYNLKYTGKTVKIKIMDSDYEIGVHSADVEGVKYYLLEHYEFFDGLYWGITSSEKLRRRVAFARACAEVILTFQLGPHYTFTNDAYIGIFNGIIRSDPYYANHPVFMRNKFLHIVHNGGWQYFDSYERYENGFDLFNLFNLPSWRYKDFTDPVFESRFNCMATGIRFSDKTITVSPSYAKQLEFASDGLERVVHGVLGISNAIGRDFREKITKRFDESGFVDDNYKRLLECIEADEILKSKIESRYHEILTGNGSISKIKDESRRYIISRMRNKLLLQSQRGLNVDPDAIIFSMIHRISEQKGFQLLLEASEGLIKNFGYQIIVGGAVSSGDRKGEELAHGLYQLNTYYPKSVNVSFGFQDVSIPLLCTDLFGMPSMHEPGGISQLEAFTSGSLVVARATGGLRDTVFPIRLRGDSIDGNGFLFTDYTAWSFYDAMNRAASFFKENNDETIYKARINAQNSVYYWDKPARKYAEEIYNMTETIRILD
jgi:starch synthase